MFKYLLMPFIFAVLAAGEALAIPIMYQAALDGPSENPPNLSPGTGSATVTYDSLAHTLRVEANFSDLIGTTTAAHIHCCIDAPGNVGVATMTPTFAGFPAGVTSGTYDHTFDLTLDSSFRAQFIADNGGTPAGAEAALAAGLSEGRAYFNIHTSTFGGGEIRGFLQAVPEPGTGALLGIGGLLWAATAWKRRMPHAQASSG